MTAPAGGARLAWATDVHPSFLSAPGTAEILQNLVVRTGGADYGCRAIQAIIHH